MGKLLGSLENLEPSEEQVVLWDDQQSFEAHLNSALIDIMEVEMEIDEHLAECTDIDDEIGEIEESVERLDAIGSVICEHGICRSTMEAVDPDGELVETGICCSWEELGDAPVADVEAEATVEGIRVTLEQTGEGLEGYCANLEEYYGQEEEVVLEGETLEIDESLEGVGDKIKAGASKVAAGGKYVGGKVAAGGKAVGSGAKKAGGWAAKKALKGGSKAIDATGAAAGKVAGAAGVVADKAKAAAAAVKSSKVGQATDKAGKFVSSKAGKAAYAVRAGAKEAGRAVSRAHGLAKDLASGAMRSGKLAQGLKMGAFRAELGILVTGALAAGAALVSLGLMARKAFTSYKKALENVAAKLSGGSFDEEKFKGMSFKAYSKADFQRAVKAAEHVNKAVESGVLTKLVGEVDSIVSGKHFTAEKASELAKKAGSFLKPVAADKDVHDILGIVVGVDEAGHISEISSKKPEIKPSKETAGAHGWHASDAHPAVEAALGLIHNSEGMVSHIDSAGKTIKQFSAVLKSHDKEAEISSEEKAAFKSIMSTAKGIIHANRSLIKYAIEASRNVSGSALQVGKAASKCHE